MFNSETWSGYPFPDGSALLVEIRKWKEFGLNCLPFVLFVSAQSNDPLTILKTQIAYYEFVMHPPLKIIIS